MGSTWVTRNQLRRACLRRRGLQDITCGLQGLQALNNGRSDGYRGWLDRTRSAPRDNRVTGGHRCGHKGSKHCHLRRVEGCGPTWVYNCRRWASSHNVLLACGESACLVNKNIADRCGEYKIIINRMIEEEG